MDTNTDNKTVSNSGDDNEQIKGIQARTGDDITSTGEVEYGEGLSIGNEDFEEDGGEDLGFEEPGIDEDEDRENPLRREADGGATSDGTNESYTTDEGRNYQKHDPDKLLVEFKKMHNA